MALWRRKRTGADGAQPGQRPGAASVEQAEARAQPVAEHRTVIDLTGGDPWSARIQSDPDRAAAMAERARRRRERAEATAELQRLRARHWSGERLVEEGRRPEEWWEHPEADPHAILGLLPGTLLSEVAAARRRIAKECHPDRTYACEADRELAQHRMIAANSAYDRLRRALMHVT